MLLRKHVSVCVIFFLWIELSLFLRTLGWVVCDSSCKSFHVPSFVVCGSSVKQVSHSWHTVLDTCVLYTFLNFIYLFISLLNLYLDSELIIINIVIKNLYSVSRSLEIHNCALTSSWKRSRQGTRYQSGTFGQILWSASRKMC